MILVECRLRGNSRRSAGAAVIGKLVRCHLGYLMVHIFGLVSVVRSRGEFIIVQQNPNAVVPDAINALIPSEIRLQSFPPEAEAIAPRTHELGYVVIEGLIAIVDQRSHQDQARVKTHTSTGPTSRNFWRGIVSPSSRFLFLFRYFFRQWFMQMS